VPQLFTYFIICFAFFFYHSDSSRDIGNELVSARFLADALAA